MQIAPSHILPSQDFLKEKTVRFILECLHTGNLAELPPTPLVRKNSQGQLVAIDGHNLIAVRRFRNEPIEVIVATSAQSGLPATSAANITRNQELADKFDTVLAEQRRVAAEGIASFDDLIKKYPDVFMSTNYDIHKAAGIIIKDRRLLVERSKGKDVFVAPGGKLEAGETPMQALVRELKEEFQFTIQESDLEEFGTFYAEAAGSHNKGKSLKMDVFIVHNVVSEPKPDNEVEEIRWISSSLEPGIEVGSIFAHDVLPKLKAQNLVD